MTQSSSPTLFGHFAVWVSVWVKPETLRKNCAAVIKDYWLQSSARKPYSAPTIPLLDELPKDS